MIASAPVALVGCAALKILDPAPAKELYASSLFKLSRRYVESRRMPWAILSAKHGVLMPDDVIEPYDVCCMTLRASGKEALREWEERVAEQLEERFPRASYVLLAGSDYARALRHLPRSRVHEPLKGLGIGKRLQWLRREGSEPVAVRHG